MKDIKVLFVCLGNICRSPTAQGVFEHLVKAKGLEQQILTDSAGTHAYHVGESPDPRSQATARAKGVDISHQRAQKVKSEDFLSFDYIIAMDSSNFHDLKQRATEDVQHKIYRFMSFASKWNTDDVPDPYYGKGNGFENVFNMLEAASDGLLIHIMKKHFK